MTDVGKWDNWKNFSLEADWKIEGIYAGYGNLASTGHFGPRSCSGGDLKSDVSDSSFVGVTRRRYMK